MNTTATQEVTSMMRSKYDILFQDEQESDTLSQELASLLESFLSPLLLILDRLLDKRLVRTLVQCCVAIIRFLSQHHTGTSAQ